MNQPDVFINVLGILYGVLLISATFIRSRLTEAMRIDALFMKGYSEKTRPLNFLAGLLVAGYGVYSLMFR
jgi:hypothetical protein